MNKWVKVYMTEDAYREWKTGTQAIGYLEHEIERMKKLVKLGYDFSLKTDPLNYMTKVDPSRIAVVGWGFHGVYIN